MKVSTHSIFNKPANSVAVTADYVQENVVRGIESLTKNLLILNEFRKDPSGNNKLAIENLTALTNTVNGVLYPELGNNNQVDTNSSPSFR